MQTNTNHESITRKLLELGPRIDQGVFFRTLEPGATTLALGNPYAFLIATVIDRGRSEINWTVPFWLKERWGHLDPHQVYQMPESELLRTFADLPKRPRFWKQAPATVQELTRLVVEEYAGKARAMWRGRPATSFQSILRGLPHVGPGLASMAIQLVERVFPGEMTGTETSALDIKSDVHTRRVLHRLGVASTMSDEAALAAARALNPKYPGQLDAPLWYVGHQWCHARQPNCGACFLTSVCPRRLEPPEANSTHQFRERQVSRCR